MPYPRRIRPTPAIGHLGTTIAIGAIILSGCRSAPTPTLTTPSVQTSGAEATLPSATVSALPTAAGTVTAVPPPATSTPSAAAGGPIRTGSFDVTLAPEASGVVVGRRDTGVRWIIDDGPPTRPVLAVDPEGHTLGQVTMVDAQGSPIEGIDIEDIAIGPCGPLDQAADGQPDTGQCLFVADIGDNNATRGSVRIHRFEEPDPTQNSVTVTTATLSYADGPHDAEALLVALDGSPIIITKQPDMAGVYVAQGFGDQTLARTADLVVPPPAAPLFTRAVGLTVTAADSTSDGTAVLLRTYDSIVELRPSTPGSMLSDLADWVPTELPSPLEPQGEAVAYLADGRGYVTVSEGTGDIWQAQR
ncbi:MAG: hypothetical protein ACR2HR_11545 [Euzebya sp.]